MMKSFYEFALKMTMVNSVCVDETDEFIPDCYQIATEAMIENLQYKMEYLDKIHIDYIESEFEENDIPELLHDKMMSGQLPDGEVPDGIINRLATGLYNGQQYNQLDSDEQSIIKVLALYIIVQILN